jgi:hypothetical protein
MGIVVLSEILDSIYKEKTRVAFMSSENGETSSEEDLAYKMDKWMLITVS